MVEEGLWVEMGAGEEAWGGWGETVETVAVMEAAVMEVAMAGAGG